MKICGAWSRQTIQVVLSYATYLFSAKSEPQSPAFIQEGSLVVRSQGNSLKWCHLCTRGSPPGSISYLKKSLLCATLGKT